MVPSACILQTSGLVNAFYLALPLENRSKPEILLIMARYTDFKSPSLIIENLFFQYLLREALQTSKLRRSGSKVFYIIHPCKGHQSLTVVPGIMSDSEDSYDSGSGGYDINDPRQREHKAYKISQDNAGRAARRFKYGDDVDANETNCNAHEEDSGDCDEEDSDTSGDHDSMELRLQNAREARGWALE